MKKTSATITAISSLLTSVRGLCGSTFAADKPEMEKCYGVSKAGKNDCAGAAHACAGQSKMDAGGTGLHLRCEGHCERLSGGT